MTMTTTISRSVLARTVAAMRLHRFTAAASVMALAFLALAVSAKPLHAQLATTNLLLGDFNGDGIQDVLVAPTTANPSAFTLTFGSVPYGSFSSSARSIPLPSGCQPTTGGATVVGDFNGDGLADFATNCIGTQTSGNPYSLFILLGNGDGSFTSSAALPGSSILVTADFNHDGILDLVSFTFDDSGNEFLTFMKGVGDGTFQASTPQQLATNSYQFAVAVDLDGDGYPDLALGNFNGVSDSVDLFRNNQNALFGSIDGTTAPTSSVALANYTGSKNENILVGNFYGTGLPDLAVADGGSAPGISVIPNLSTDGFGFSAPNKFSVPGLVTAKSASFTSIFTDFLVQTSSTLSVLANDGTGNFTASYAALSVPNALNNFAAADANFDGHADIYTAVVTSTGLSLAVNLVSGTASASSTPFTLPLGSSPVTAAWPGNFDFIGSTLTGTQIVGGITPTITWPTPAAVPYGTALSATQLDATATTPSGATVPGVFVYTPAAGTVPGVGTQTLSVVFTPTDLVTYTVATGTVTLTVNQATPVITWTPNPDTIVALTPLTAAQLDAISSVPGTFAYTPALGAMLVSGTQTLSAVFTPTDAVDYKTVTTTTTLLVTTGGLNLAPKPLSFGNQAPGTRSAAQVVTVTNPNATVVNISQIALEAGPNPNDFLQTNNCPAALQALAACQVTITFAPKGVGLRTAGLVIVDDSTPSQQGVDMTGTGVGGVLQVNPGNLKTIAGNGTSGYAGDGGLATIAELGSPDGIAFDSKGNLYIADITNAVVRKVDTSGNITTFAGNGTVGYSGDGAAATAAELYNPFSVTVDAADNVYIEDTGNDVIRKVDSKGIITTFAGTGQPGHAGDGGPAIDARFNQNQGARFDKAGNLYVPQCNGASVRKIDTSGNISTVAGNFTEGFSGDGGPATSAQLQCPSAVAIDSTGNLFIADYFNNRIRKVDTSGVITTIAGDGNAAFLGDGGPATAAEINLPNDLAFDLAGNLFIVDSNNGRIRKIDTKGIITTAAGGFENAGSPGVNTPGGLTSDAAGNMYFSDTGNATVSEIFPIGTTPLPTTALGATAAPQTLTLSNVGNVAFSIAAGESFSLSGNTTDFTLSGGTCLSGATLAANGGSCTLQITFKPTAAGQRSVTISVVDSALNSPQSFTVGGTATQAAPVITWPAPASIAYGVSLSATQLDATAADINGATLPGTFVYTPAAGSTPAPGVQTLSVTFTPTDAVDYKTATATVDITITDVTLSSFTPNTAALAAPATTITIIGSGLVSTTVVQVNGTAIATTLVNPTTLTAVIPASYFLVPGTLQVTLMNPATGSVSGALGFTVTAPTLSGTLNGPPTTAPGTQPSLTFNIEPYPVDVTAMLTVTLKSSIPSGLTDTKNVVFANNMSTYSFTVKAGSTSIPSIPLAAGTIAETITVTPTLFIGTANVTPEGLAPITIDVPASVPQATSTTLTRSGNQLTVTFIGFSNTREIVSAAFHFVAAPGSTLTTTDFSPTVDDIFSTWYGGDTSPDFGSSFTYSQVFNVSDQATSIGSVQVTLTNSIGTSTVQTAQ